MILFSAIFGEQKTWFNNLVILSRSFDDSFASINSAHFSVTEIADRSEKTELKLVDALLIRFSKLLVKLPSVLLHPSQYSKVEHFLFGWELESVSVLSHH